jgi:hypothetical protein
MFSTRVIVRSAGVEDISGSPEVSTWESAEAMCLFDAMNKTKGIRRPERDVNMSEPQFRIVVRAPWRVPMLSNEASGVRRAGTYLGLKWYNNQPWNDGRPEDGHLIGAYISSQKIVVRHDREYRDGRN